MSRVKAPYVAGDKVKILHSVQGGTVLGVLPIDRVVALNDGKSWRLEMTRNDPEFPMLSAVVGVNGRDKHGYVERAPGRGMAPFGDCGTEGCTGRATWIPISEGNKGSRVFRCVPCCDRIAEALVSE
jgi:hypothetical protein